MKLSSADADSIVFTIAAHKTASTHGAATVAINKTEAQLLQGYMRFRLLPQIADASAYVFVSTTKTPVTQSNVASALTLAFASSGYTDRVNCTKFRKLAVTQIHQKHPEKRHDLASHMCHRVATAEKHYRLMEKKSNSVARTDVLRQVVCGENVENESSAVLTDSATTAYCKRFVWSRENRDIIFQKFSRLVAEQRAPLADVESILFADPDLVTKN